jgi:hypothetical protein
MTTSFRRSLAVSTLLSAVLAVLFAAGATMADDRAADDRATKALFDGKSTEGWTVTDCKVEVKDGALLLADGNGTVRTNEKFRDYILSWECKAGREKDYDSGVFVRFDLPFPKGRNWPGKYQVNLKEKEEGNIKDLKGASSTGLCKAGDWNRFKLTVEGSKAELEINGKPAWKADGLKVREGYIGLQAEIPAGGQYWFRKIEITPK